MSIRKRHNSILPALVLTLVLILSPFPIPSPYAGELEQPRVLAGLDLFPILLSADVHIEEKKAGNELILLLVYDDEVEMAQKTANHLGSTKAIRGIPLRIDLIDYKSLGQYDEEPAGIFLVQHLDSDRFNSILEYGREKKIIVLSPFEGDVEKGATAGIFVGFRIYPYINAASLKLSGIEIKPFFLRIAKLYE